MKTFIRTILLGAIALQAATSFADERAIRKTVTERVPQLKQIDEVQKTEFEGIYEVRANGTELYYTDAKASFLMQGQLIDMKSGRNLTYERTTKLMAIKFQDLPLKDSFTIVRGNGQRKLAVFQDPNCGYCKRFERDLQNINNVTIHMFLYPILGPDSKTKSEGIWCSKDAAKTWQDWMVRDVPVAAAGESCDNTSLARNIEFGKNHKITGTPTLIFIDGSRVPGAIDAKQVEKHLSETKG